MEMACFSLLMRSHESIRPWANAQFDAPEVLPHTVRLTRIHVALRPYLERCLACAKEGVAVLRPDFWEAMDFGASRDPYAYFLGDELFIAPVIDLRVKTRRVSLPAGDWVHLWSGTAYAGGETYTVAAPLGQPPVFYRRDGEFRALFASLKDISAE
jgi:alpha-glucosidase